MAAENMTEKEATGSGGGAEPEYDKLAFVLEQHGITGPREMEVRAIINEMLGSVAKQEGEAVAKKFEDMFKKKEEEAAAKKKLGKEKRAGRPIEELNPRDQERALRKQQKQERKQRKEAEAEKEKKRKSMPALDLSEAGHIEPSSYFVFKSTLSQIIQEKFKLHDFWSVKDDGKKRSEEEKTFVIEQLRDRFSNGARLDRSFITKKIGKSLTDKRNHQRTLS
ncbi:unnamed protein product [Calypogeia fissa]